MQCLWFKYDLRNAEIQYGQHCDVYTVFYKLMCEFYKFKCNYTDMSVNYTDLSKFYTSKCEFYIFYSLF